ncbi:MAG: hypothetical protein ABI766_06320 [Gemmatimonadales bacterium]
MTTDEFNARYTLLNQIAHGKSRTFMAQEAGSERAVMVHFLTEDRHPPGSAIAGLVERLAPPDRAKVLEILPVNLSTAVVTQTLEPFDRFDAWLQSRLAEIPAPPPVAHPPAPSAQGEFTSLFQPPAVSLPTPPPAPSRPAPPPAPVPDVGPRGGFTDLFQPPTAPKSNPLPVPSIAAPPVEMRSIRLPRSESAPAPVHRPSSSDPPLPRPAWPLSLEPGAGAPLAPPPLHSPVLPAPLPRPRAGEPIIKPPPREQLPPPSPLPGWSGESDYTRQLRPAPLPDQAPPVAPVAPVPESAKKPEAEAGAGASRPLVPLLLVLNVLVIIATGLVLYFALKRK